MPGSLVDLRSLTRRFGEVLAVDRLDLTVAAGEILALVGPNGALAEELLFRGFIQRGLGTGLTARWAVPLTALLFALVHPPASFPAVLLLGLTTGILAQRRGWLLAPVLCHATYNLIVLTGSWLR